MILLVSGLVEEFSILLHLWIFNSIFNSNHNMFSNFVAADYDLTGQLVWPGAVLLNNYLSMNSEILKGKSVIELGSGVGKLITNMPFHLSSNNYIVNVIVVRYHWYIVQ